MTVVNLNKPILDTPEVQQMAFTPVIGIAGSCLENDGDRFIYHYIQTSATAAQFWRYDSLADCWQQITTPPTQTGTVANMTYCDNTGGQFSGKTYGSIYLFVGNGTTAYFYRYDIATNVWTAMSVASIPAAFATDCYLSSLSPHKDNFESDYHTGVTRSIATSASVAVGATSIAVTALPEALTSGTRLRFGSFNITLSAGAAKGATTLAVTSLPDGLASGAVLTLSNGDEVVLNGAVASGATSITVFPLQRAIPSGTVILVEKYVVLTASAAAAAVSITVSSVLYTIASGATAPYYGQMYLIGHAAAVLYRYNIGANLWYTTSANAGNPAIPAIPAATGGGCAIKWMPAYYQDKIYILRGGGNSTIYTYDLVANTMATVTYNPATEVFNTGTSIASRSLNGKNGKILIHKENTGRIYEFCPLTLRMRPKFIQNKLPYSTAVAGDRSCIFTSPDGVEFFYTVTSSSNYLARIALLDS